MDEPRVVLETRDVTKRFSGITAVDHVSIQLHEGEILGIIGPNGAGKTTLFDLISGFLTARRGPDHPRGPRRHQDASAASRRARARAARSRTPACSAHSPCTRPSAWRSTDRSRCGTRSPRCSRSPRSRPSASCRSAADELVSVMGLDDYRDKFVSDLSTGSRRIVDLACQIGSNPKVILFDEPSSGIAQRETEALGPLLLRIRDITGASILVIEHDMPLITAVSDRIVACDLGQVVVDGDAELVLNHPQVVASYLGTTRRGHRSIRHRRRGCSRRQGEQANDRHADCRLVPATRRPSAPRPGRERGAQGPASGGCSTSTATRSASRAARCSGRASCARSARSSGCSPS